MRLSLFEDSENVYHAKAVDFERAVESKQIEKVVLKGYRDRGFFVRGKFSSKATDLTCVLVNSRSKVMYIKDPDRAHDILYDMGIEDFEIDTSEWDMESAFNPHKVSQESRQRKKRREDALRFRPVFLDKYRYAYNHIQIEQRIQKLVAYAVESGWLEQVKDVPKRKFFMWSESRDLPDHKKVPTWAMRAAVALTVDCGQYPRNDIEMASFASLWFSIHGPFETTAEAYNSLPCGFVDTVMEAGVSRAWIDMVLNDEVLHVRSVKRAEEEYQASKTP